MPAASHGDQDSSRSAKIHRDHPRCAKIRLDPQRPTKTCRNPPRPNETRQDLPKPSEAHRYPLGPGETPSRPAKTLYDLVLLRFLVVYECINVSQRVFLLFCRSRLISMTLAGSQLVLEGLGRSCRVSVGLWDTGWYRMLQEETRW